jgi:hypothetical protein
MHFLNLLKLFVINYVKLQTIKINHIFLIKNHYLREVPKLQGGSI